MSGQHFYIVVKVEQSAEIWNRVYTGSRNVVHLQNVEGFMVSENL